MELLQLLKLQPLLVVVVLVVVVQARLLAMVAWVLAELQVRVLLGQTHRLILALQVQVVVRGSWEQPLEVHLPHGML
jgi:hypothetical protein